MNFKKTVDSLISLLSLIAHAFILLKILSLILMKSLRTLHTTLFQHYYTNVVYITLTFLPCWVKQRSARWSRPRPYLPATSIIINVLLLPAYLSLSHNSINTILHVVLICTTVIRVKLNGKLSLKIDKVQAQKKQASHMTTYFGYKI